MDGYAPRLTTDGTTHSPRVYRQACGCRDGGPSRPPDRQSIGESGAEVVAKLDHARFSLTPVEHSVSESGAKAVAERDHVGSLHMPDGQSMGEPGAEAVVERDHGARCADPRNAA